MSWFKKMTCDHEYIQFPGLTYHTEKIDNDKYVYECKRYVCEKCDKELTLKGLDRVDKNYYLNHIL